MLKCLIVDDSKLIRKFMKNFLIRRLSCEVITAGDALSGLEKLNDEIPDIIFLDLNMPGMSGIDFLKKIREDDYFSETPIIMLTSISDAATVKEIMEYGVLDYIIKPFNIETTTEKLKLIFSELKSRGLPLYAINEEKLTDDKKKYKSMLIIEKDIETIAVILNLFKYNFKLYYTESGYNGYKMISEIKPSVVILGENLSDVNENVLVNKIKSNKSKTKIIFIKSITEEISDDDKDHFNFTVYKKDDNKDYFETELKKAVYMESFR